MRRFARWLLRTTAIACVLLAVVAVVLWPIGYRDYFMILLKVGTDRGFGAGTVRGRIIVWQEWSPMTRWILTGRFPISPSDRLDADPPDAWHGFYVGSIASTPYVTLPTLAAIVMLSAGAAGAWLTARRLRGPRDPTRCRDCGYDLRATPARCPECGRPA